ncbi:uncharacterized protein [Primulina huaijiensis]|uniref:uncharacterized protein isoform X1 n=1 Tax=Primulina huaijiensis TaxID=1492673 RepID=UPI003CC71CD0
MAQNDYRGLEHGVLKGAPPPKEKIGIGFQAEQARRYGKKTTTPATYDSSYYPPLTQYRDNSRRPIQRAERRRHQPNRAATAGVAGAGMQAIFLGSNQKSTGTGVFLPRRDGIDPKFSKKPAVSPVLLPSRVVHALNLNVRELGQKIKPQPGEPKNGTVKNTEEKSKNNNEEDDDDICLSPEIYLPEEWTY